MYIFIYIVKRIKKDIEKYHAVIDVVPKSDKITLVHS